MARHLVRLQFTANGPAVEGEWTVLGPAEDRYTKWIGLYDTGLAVPAVVIQLITETDGAPARTQDVDGARRVRGWLRRWDRRALVGGFGERSGSPTLRNVAESWQQAVAPEPG